ncbi:aminotransferase class I/II-fold pyridoxal phosphate-dependent enzyme [Streptomyces sp. NPDC047002]|uniref:aminotransferase class I/II-fold pyridoxal phosphate-dependent enzyme n=1 Tax=Streptomyces sp. NPDC047002 TaxID=3155475 RepID=UPI0034555D4B
MTTPRPDHRRNASPFLNGTEPDAVARVLESGQYGHTDVTEEFEHRIAAYLGVPDAVAVTSGTAALHSALLAADIVPGDEVIVPSMTFCATVQAILAVGATPRFIDIDPATLCVTPQLIEEAVTDATAAVLPVLFGGRAIDLTPIHDHLNERGISVIADAAHAFGSRNGTHLVGSDSATLTCFSFGPIKNLTCGQGGAVIPRTPEEAATLRRLRLLGVAQSQSERAETTTYQVAGFGLRYQLSALNAAIGLAQLDTFDTTAATRRRLWHTYRDALTELDGVALIDVGPDHAVPHLCQVRVQHRDDVFAHLRKAGIGVGVHYPPNHLQPAFALWSRPLPATEQVGTEILSLPFHQHLTEAEIHHVVTSLRDALQHAGGRVMPTKLLTVCLGNYCRSPFAQLALTRRSGPAVAVRSAGLISKWQDQPANPTMTKAARRLGYDLTAHRGRHITLEMLRWADTVLAMDASVLTTLRTVFGPRYESKTGLYLDDHDVPDPIGQDDASFFECAVMIEAGTALHLT